MITAGTKERKVESNASETSTMKIENPAKIFEMLTSSLYSNIAQSIVREIWSNARDAHADAGCLERPFEVTFPTVFNPTFRVRDFGIGLTHEQVMGLYANLGASTKENSNKGVGKFGIGSKSPFAYSDSFNVITYMNGEKRFYSVMLKPVYKYEDGDGYLLDEQGEILTSFEETLELNGNTYDGLYGGSLPVVSVMGEPTPTDQENGVEVTFAIENNDVDKFRKAAQRVAFGFDVKPIVTDNEGKVDENFEGWKELPVISQGKGWTLLSGSIEGYHGQAFAKMGCVLYPINSSEVDGLSEQHKRMLNHTMIIEFPIGALDITPNREQLKYGRLSPTSKSIVRRLSGIIDEMVAETMKVYTEAETYWEACTLYREHLRADVPSAIKEAIKGQAQWRGEKLEETIMWKSPGGGAYVSGIAITEISKSKLSNLTYRWAPGYRIAFTPSPNTYIFIEDMTVTPSIKLSAGRLRKFISEERIQNKTKIDSVIWIKFYGGKDGQNALISLYEKIDGANIQNLGDLPEPPKGSHGTRGPVQARRMTSYGSFDTKVDLSAEDFDKGGFYIPLERNEPVYPPHAHASPSSMVAILRKLGEISADASVYGAPKSLWKRFEGDQWINVYEFAETVYAKKFKAAPIVKAKAMDAVTGNSFLRFVDEHIDPTNLSDGSSAKEAVAFFNKVLKMNRPDAENMSKLASAVGKEINIEDMEHDLITERDKYVKALEEEYPLLSSIANHCRHAKPTLAKLTDYVYMCDTANAANSNPAAKVA